MALEVWFPLAGFAVTGAGAAIAYGVLKQKVADLKDEGKKMEVRVTACETGHVNAANEMNALRVDVAILTERSRATVESLDRIERHLSAQDADRAPPAPRTRTRQAR